MSITSIDINKESVASLLVKGKDKPFVIPEYQRPYAWTEDHAQTLFEDIWDFAENKGGTQRENTYFLGSIVSYENKKGEQEIIDGQQRITSLFLLLRAIYTKLKGVTETDESKNFINQIEPTLWKKDKLTGKVNFEESLLTSRVISNEGNKVLKSILETGTTNEKAKDNYSKNYKKFQSLLDEKAQNNPLMIYQFIYALLNQSILLPIIANNQDTALTIFSTLNNRGLPLSDADIFKAKIYDSLKVDKAKSNFIEEWQKLDEETEEANESIQQLFYYYMFYLRAKEKDKSTTTPGVRKYYLENNHLYANDLMSNLKILLNLWKVINNREKIENEPWTENKGILCLLDIISSYPNEFWKYPVVIYYLSHKDTTDFEQDFEKFLKKFITEMLSKYIMTPTINAVKSDILKLNAEIVSSTHPVFEFKDVDENELKIKVKTPHKSVVRMLLKLLAYQKQDVLLPYKWEIEHILPQKWQANYFLNNSETEIREKIEHLGNKLPFEKKLNIVAGNGYFGKKKAEYDKSDIEITKEFAKQPNKDWKLDEIIERDTRVSDEITDIFKAWNKNYNSTSESPSDEDKLKIEEFKKKGWI